MMKDDMPVTARSVATAKPKLANIAHNDAGQAKRSFEDSLSKTARKLLKVDDKILNEQVSGMSAFSATNLLGATLVQAPSSTGPNAQMAAHLERIAAAIAEVAVGGAKAEVVLTLPKGATGLDGAIIGRNEAGALHIMLTSPNAIAPAQAAMLQASLHDRLRQRDIRVGKVSLQKVERRGTSLNG
jgi:hypothetical protein